MRCPQIGFIVLNENRTPIINANNQFLKTPEFERPVRKGTIRCSLGKVPLVAGNYTISIWFGVGHIDTHVEIDALGFEVIDRDIWGTGKTPPSADATMWWPVNFSFITEDGQESVTSNSIAAEFS